MLEYDNLIIIEKKEKRRVESTYLNISLFLFYHEGKRTSLWIAHVYSPSAIVPSPARKSVFVQFPENVVSNPTSKNHQDQMFHL